MENEILTGKIMKRVVSFEKRRTLVWVARTLFMILALMVAAIVALILIVGSLLATGTLELLTLFGEDRETINEFWQDTLGTVWRELPKEPLAIVLLSTAVVVAIILISRKKSKVAQKRLSEIRKYEMKHF